MSAPVLIGTCNWADHTDFYPSELRGARHKERLSYYARFFPLVEVDTTFYGIPPPSTSAGWVERTPEGFLFNVKAYRSLTRHERDQQKRPRNPTDDEVRAFLEAIRPLRDARRLVAVHYQFPPWFTNTPANRDVLAEARDRHPDDIVAIEFRHRSWFDNGAWPHTEKLLRELETTLVGVDAPQIGDGTAPRHLAITSPRLAIIRFHGRNRTTWYRGGPTSGDRFNYLYTRSELEQWAPTIRAAADADVPVHLLLNNNKSNYAVVNAFDFASILDVPLPPPPGPILATMRGRGAEAPSQLVIDATDS